jgi:large subunit ribosomal protein L4
MKLKVYNLAGKSTDEIEVSDEVFAVAIKPEVVHEVFVAQTNNLREPWAHSKNKGEVSGGGKKPWAQKGTGRARHGSSRSPIWKGGGVTFGPLNIRNYKSKINKKIRRLATKMCLTDKAQNNDLLVVENFSFTEPKTKLFAGFLKSLPTAKHSFLVLVGNDEKEVIRMSDNLPKVKTLQTGDVNVLELLGKQVVIISKDSITKLEEILKK